MAAYARFPWCGGLVLALGVVAVLHAPAAHAATYSGGSGTEMAPYLISTPQDLQDLSNPANSADWDKHFLMTQDIDMVGVTGFTPIAPDTDLGAGSHQGTMFTGVFDGGGYAVQNLVIDLPTQDYVGLFGYVDGSAVEIHDLGIQGGSVTGSNYIGGLLGCNRDGVTLTGCYATGAVSGSDRYVGGLVGYNRDDGTLTGCYATGAVSGTNYVGGLVGRNADGTITGCYATGAVSGTGDNVGGLVGLNSDGGTVSASFWDLETSGQSGSSGGKGVTTAQMTMVATFQNAGWEEYEWVMTAGQYPRLDWEGTGMPTIPAPEPIPLSGSGIEGDPYRVTTAQELAALSWHTGYLDAHLLLTTDLDCAGVTLYPIGDLGVFSGVFDGGGHTIANATIEQPGSDYVGLFSTLGSGAEIRDLGLENNVIMGGDDVGGLVGWNRNGGTLTGCYATGAVTGYDSVGGLVGRGYNGTITGCYVTGAVSGSGQYTGGLVGQNRDGTLTSCYATSTVSGTAQVGGLVGYNYEGTVTSCYATGAVSGTNSVGGLVGYNSDGTLTDCYATGAVTGDNEVGGLVGDNYGSGTIMGCYATGAVTGSGQYVGGLVGRGYNGTVTGCYATGAVTGTGTGTYTGGLVGGNYGTVSGSFWDLETSGQSGSSGGKGVTTAQMMMVATFQNAGWATYGWVMTAGDYPRLDWEATGYPVIPAPEAIPLSGSGTEVDPYLVTTEEEFAALSWHIGYLDAHLLLTTDLDCAAVTLYPIGDLDIFSGVFDGGGHVIRDVVIEQPGNYYVGLFSRVDALGMIADLALTDALVAGGNYAGGLAGASEGSITRCYANASVSCTKYGGGLAADNRGTLEECHASGEVAADSFAGGLVAENNGTIAACYATGDIVTGANAGGLAAYNGISDSIESSYATGDVSGSNGVGGLVGENSGIISCSYATGPVDGLNDVGGLIGKNLQSASDSYALGSVSGTNRVGGVAGSSHFGVGLANCYATGAVSGSIDIGGAVGSGGSPVSACFWDSDIGGPDNEIGDGLTTEEMQQRATFEGAGWDFSAGDGDDPDWLIYEDVTYPLLYAMPIPINSISSLQQLNIASGGEFFLTGDIDASETAGWSSKSTQPGFSPIGSSASPFEGILHGYGHRIHGLHIYRPAMDEVGLFGYVGAMGVVDDLGLEQVSIIGRDLVGGLAGVNLGTVERCYVRGEVSGVNAVGGLIGDNQGTVSKSYAAAALSGNTVGGLIGTDSSKGGKGSLPAVEALGGQSASQEANTEDE